MGRGDNIEQKVSTFVLKVYATQSWSCGKADTSGGAMYCAVRFTKAIADMLVPLRSGNRWPSLAQAWILSPSSFTHSPMPVSILPLIKIMCGEVDKGGA